MRRFVIVGHTQRSTPPLPLADPCGAGGRWDLLARCVTSALLVSHGIRRDTEICLALAGPPPRALRLEGAAIRNLNPDERSTLALLSRALETPLVGQHEERAAPGLHVSARGLEEILEAAHKDGPVAWLHPDGESDPLVPPGADTSTFVLSDHREFTSHEAELLARAAWRKVRLGPVVLHADQCVVLVHHALDVAALAG